VLIDVLAILTSSPDVTRVRIEGHTDAVPIRSNSYRSNWELSAARAAAVLSFFADSTSIEEGRMSVAGYGSQRPLAPNDTTEGRSQNRRVDIVVLEPREQKSTENSVPAPVGKGT
jgi:chemotaxis protein MotB